MPTSISVGCGLVLGIQLAKLVDIHQNQLITYPERDGGHKILNCQIPLPRLYVSIGAVVVVLSRSMVIGYSYTRYLEPLSSSVGLRALFVKALTLAPVERERFFDQERLSPETRHELAALLEADLGSETFLSGIVGRAEIRASHAGERFGPFETRELVGVGGMGAVFRAERVDGELSQVVAIKVVERLFLDPRSAERFRRERELLARLEHPNVARLLGRAIGPSTSRSARCCR